MISTTHSLILIAVTAGVTILLRFLPFLIFRKGTPAPIMYLGEVLPYSIIGMLVVYCLKNITPFQGNHALPELFAVLLVVLLHKWRHNTLLSIAVGTIFYMILVQMVFAA